MPHFVKKVNTDKETKQNVFPFVTVLTGSAKKASHYLADACCVFYRIAVATSL